MLTGYIILIVISTLIARINRHSGIWLMILVGLLADPVRKMIPGTPVYISLGFLPIFAVLFFSIVFNKKRDGGIFSYFPDMRTPFRIFLLILIINSLRSVIAAPGAFALVVYSMAQYTGWVIAMVFGFYLVENETDLVKFEKMYLLTVTPFLITVFFHLFGWQQEWPVLRAMEFSEAAYTTERFGGPLELLNGLFRNPEPMGWHAMTAAICALFLLVSGRKKMFERLCYGILFLLSASCAVLSARRKFPIGIVIFVASFLLLTLQKSFKKTILYSSFLVILLGIGGHYFIKTEGGDRYLKSAQSGFEAFHEESERRVIGSIFWAIRRDGFFGRGLGAAPQGSRHVKSAELVQGPGIESGSGKMISELGVPGTLILIYLLFLYLKNIYALYKSKTVLTINKVTIAFLISVVVTNAALFLLSHQVYADPLIGMLTFMSFGFLLAVPKMSGNSTSSGKRVKKASET